MHLDLSKLPQRFLDKFIPEPNSGCWIWLVSNGSKYGIFWFKQKYVIAHRFVYETLVEPIPKGLEIDHKCKTKCCVNPDHLEPVTKRENGLRSLLTNLGKTHCKHGHEFNEENTILRKYGGRDCKICRKIRNNKRTMLVKELLS